MRVFLTAALQPLQLRLYSRDLELSNANVLHAEHMQASVLLMSLFDNSLLVYTAEPGSPSAERLALLASWAASSVTAD